MILASASSTHASTETVGQHQPNHSQIKAAVNSNQLILAVGIFDPKFQSISTHSDGSHAIASQDYGIIQFENGKADYKWLQKQGFDVIQSLSNNAYVVNWKNVEKTLLERNDSIRWHGPYLSNFKIAPNLWQNQRSALSSYEISVKFFKDYPLEKMQQLIRKYAPQARLIQSNIPKSEKRLAIQLPASQLDSTLYKLASAEGVQWINKYFTEKFNNTEAVAAVQNTSSSFGDHDIWDAGIIGTGQIIGVADSGLDGNEDWFTHYDDGNGDNHAATVAADVFPPLVGPLSPNNKVIGNWVMPGAAAYDHTSASFHGTHVSGSVAGDRLNCVGSECDNPFGYDGEVSTPVSPGYDDGDGMAPNAQILFQDIGSNGGLTGAGSSPMWKQAHDAGAYVHNNSYGSSSLGEYISSDQNLDRSLRDLDNMIILTSAGNDDGPNNTTGSPGNAKNATTVGALLHGNSTTVAGFSNRGLTDDGRLKPDISATGTSIVSAGGNTQNGALDETPSFRTLSGTSMSSPITTGATALIRQYFTDGFYPTGAANPTDSLKPSGPLMKAMLINGANTDTGFNSKDVGWGRPWLSNTLPLSGGSKSIKFWDITHESGLQSGESTTFEVEVQDGEEFRATLTWYDVPGPTGSGITLVNNLDLTVVTPNDTYLANNFVNDVSVTGGSADVLNTVEQVRFTAPVAGTYQITVSAPDVPGDGTFGSDQQGYALVVSGELGSLSPTAIGNPSNLVATANGLSGIDMTWQAATDADYYEVYRSDGTCANFTAGELRYVGQSNSVNFTDDTTIGGFDYAYHVRAFNSDNESELTNCSDSTSAQACPIPPTFTGSSSQINNHVSAVCQIGITWDQATSNCPNNGDVTYNIYRGNSHNFTPEPGNLYASTNSSETSFVDYMVTDSTNYYYRISAINDGNESLFSPELARAPIGQASAIEGSITDNDGSGDSNLLMSLESPWSVSNDGASNGNLSYRSALEGATTYSSNVCARAYSPTISIPSSPSSAAELAYKARYQIEAEWDGVVVEISTDGGDSWVDLAPNGGYPGDFSQTGDPAINACGYPASQGAINGTTNGSFNDFTHDLSAYHGQDVQIRWSFSTDPGFEEEGFFIDEITYNNVYTPSVCGDLNSDIIFENGFESNN